MGFLDERQKQKDKFKKSLSVAIYPLFLTIHPLKNTLHTVCCIIIQRVKKRT